jgi:hypothetical protein
MQAFYVVLAIGVAIAWVILVFVGPRKIDTTNSLAVLRYGAFLRMLALVLAFVLPMITVYVVSVFLWPTREKMNLAGTILLILSLIAGLPLIEVTRTRIVVTEDGVTVSSPWSGTIAMKWIEVARVRYSHVNRWFVIESRDRTVRVSRHLIGVDVFAETLKRKVATERWVSAANALATIK